MYIYIFKNIFIFYPPTWENTSDTLFLSAIHLEGSVSLFHAMSTFVGYLMPKPFSQKDCSGTI